MPRPNLLLICWHDLGDWLGCYGRQPSPSPVLDRFAGEGAALDRCFSCAPICCPSRGGMFTGLMPFANGVDGQINRGWDLREGVPTLPKLLAAAGYDTHLLGFSHSCQDPRREGYEQYHRVDDGHHAATAHDLLPRLARSERPFFVMVNTGAVHRAFGPVHDPEVAERVTVPPYLPDHPGMRADIACYQHYIGQADARVGELLAALDRSGARERTLVLFTTDHGMPWARAKHSCYDPGLRIASLWRWPGRIAAGSRLPQLLSNLDVLPTLLELLGIGADLPRLHGRSFAPLLLGRDGFLARSEVFAGHTYGVNYCPTRAIRTERFKYIASFEPRRPNTHEPQMFGRLGEELLTDWYSAPLPPEELYDLAADPDEFANLANAPRYGAVRRELRRRLLGFLRAEGDPLMAGPVPDPSGPHTPARTIVSMWREDEDGLFVPDLPPEWRKPSVMGCG